jgi:disulfide bond formation protein DsbB
MYPLALILLIGWITRDRQVRRYAVPIALLGLAASTWHYLLQQVPSLSDANSCTLATPCSVTYIEKFGFISIPWMAGSVFLLTLVLLVGVRSSKSRIG